MKRKKAILEALVFSSIMTLAIPGMAGAATTNIGSVTVDGVNTLPSTKRNTSTVGKAGSAVSIGKMEGTDPYSFYLVGDQKVDVLGKKVDSSAMMAANGSNLQAGNGDTDTVTITGNPVASDSKSTWGQYGIMALGRGAKVKV